MILLFPKPVLFESLQKIFGVSINVFLLYPEEILQEHSKK